MNGILVIVTIVGLLMPLESSAGIFTFIHKSGGTRNSDNTVTYDKVNVARGILITRIECRDGGVNGCPEEVVGPGRPADSHTEVEQAAVNYAKQQISSGALTGNTQFTVSGNSNVKRLKWDANSIYQEDGYIKVWVEGEPEPN